MAAPHLLPAPLNQLIQALDAAMDHPGAQERAEAVRDAISKAIQTHPELLPAQFLQPIPDRYARRLVHLDPQGRYSMVAMVWGLGQGTPLHDHDGHWCVECVYRGAIRMVSYVPVEGLSGPLWQFRREREEVGHIGAAEAFVPPFEFHTIENQGDEVAVTLHVYAESLTRCRIYRPVEGGYLAEVRALPLID